MRGWSIALVVGGTLGSALLFGGVVALFIWFSEPVRFEGLKWIALAFKGLLCLGWSGSFLALRWNLRRRGGEGRRSPLTMGATVLALLGPLFFAIHVPSHLAFFPLTVGLGAGLATLVLLLGFAQRRALLEQIGNVKTVERLLGQRSPQLRAARGILIVISVALCLVALARPQLHEGTKLVSRRGIDIVVALDFSKSMLARDVQPSRIDLAKLELDHFIKSLGGDRVGLVAFAGDPIQFPLTTDYEAATLFWRNLDPYDMPVGGTALGRALNAGLQLFENDRLASEREKVIVLLTDGEDHEGDPIEVARRAAGQDIQIHVLGIGGETPELIPQLGGDGSWSGFQRDPQGEYVTTALTAENEGQLREIAEVSGGSYFRAAPGQIGVDLIRREIRQLRQAQLEERRVPLYGEAFQYFLVFGLLALIVGSSLPRGRPGGGKNRTKKGGDHEA